MKTRCKFCPREIDNRGMLSHLHFRHKTEIIIEFRMNPVVAYYAEMWPPQFWQKQLPARASGD